MLFTFPFLKGRARIAFQRDPKYHELPKVSFLELLKIRYFLVRSIYIDSHLINVNGQWSHTSHAVMSAFYFYFLFYFPAFFPQRVPGL